MHKSLSDTAGAVQPLETAPNNRNHAVELRKHWWARRVSNPRPLVCKTRALPLSYTPVPVQATRPRPATENHQPDLSAVNASVHRDWSRASPGCFISENRMIPERSMTNVPRLAIPASELNTP